MTPHERRVRLASLKKGERFRFNTGNGGGFTGTVSDSDPVYGIGVLLERGIPGNPRRLHRECWSPETRVNPL